MGGRPPTRNAASSSTPSAATKVKPPAKKVMGENSAREKRCRTASSVHATANQLMPGLRSRTWSAPNTIAASKFASATERMAGTG